jgi:hypothetical protein
LLFAALSKLSPNLRIGFSTFLPAVSILYAEVFLKMTRFKVFILIFFEMEEQEASETHKTEILDYEV